MGRAGSGESRFHTRGKDRSTAANKVRKGDPLLQTGESRRFGESFANEMRWRLLAG
jgi:hypothetical protein